MKLYVAAATIMEIEPLIESPLMQDHQLVITGVGSVATTYHLTKIIRDEKPNLIIQAGIGGAFDHHQTLGDVVIVKRDRIADLGVEEKGQWHDLVDLRLAHENDTPYSEGWMVNESNRLEQYELRLVDAITINEITTNEKRITALREKYHPIIESMEGAALHYVCLQENIPFIQLRAVSNYVGERDKSKWKMDLAIKNLNDALARIIEQCK
jgi:futalosine hydrolase